MEAYKYKGRNPVEVAKELDMDIDDFLDELHDHGYYYCYKCQEIVDVEQLVDENHNPLEAPCDKCKDRRTHDFYILKIRCGCEFNGMLGPFMDEPSEEKIKEMHDDPAYVDDSLFVIKVTKDAEVDFL